MILAVDIGNTDTKFGVFEGTELVTRWSLHTDPYRSRAEVEDLIRAMLAYREVDRIEGAVMGSVVPLLTPVITEAVTAVCECAPIVVRPDAVPGITLRVDFPEQVGVDRVANAVAARALHGVPAVVADFGSTSNFDVVDRSGDLIGVIIMPGMRTSARALTAAGAKLPEINIERPGSLVGTNTVAAMQSGIYWGHVHMVRGVIGHLREELGADCKAIATGGLAPIVVEEAGVFDAVDLDITLKGMIHIKAAMEDAR